MNAFWNWLVKPPYRGVPFLVITYFIFCCLMLPYGGVFTGHLFGYDDQVRMTQVLAWVNGAPWYDHTIMRANPPEGFTTIWTRIVDIPLAAVVVIAQQFVPQRTAALIAAAFIPLLELAVLFIAAPYFVRPLVGKDKARLIILFLMFTSILSLKYFSQSGFMIGQASHHPWYVILYLVMFGAATRIAIGSTHPSPVLMLGGAIALLTAVGIEGYPMIAGMAVILALVAWGGGRPVVGLRGGMGVLCGAVGGLLLLPMHRPPQDLFAISFVDPSILGIILVASAALFLFAEYAILTRTANKYLSAFLLCLVAGILGCGLVMAFPDMLNGAAAGLSPAERKMNMEEHFEAKSVYAVSRTLWEFISLIAPTVIALVAGIVATVTARTTRRRALFFCYLGFAALGGAMSEIFSRYFHHAMTSACAWLLWLWEQFKARLKKDIHYSLKALAGFIALGPFWMLLLPAINFDLPFKTNILLFPAAIQASPDVCDSLSLADYINTHYNKDALLIVPDWDSHKFLYQTDIRINFVANYPSHDKFIENRLFFNTIDERVSASIAARHGLDLVAVCASPPMHLMAMPEDRQPFIAKLQTGHVPMWLKPVNTGLPINYRLYEIDKAALAQGSGHE